MHFRQYRITQTIDICFMIYCLFNSKYQISYRCFISWRCIFKTSQFFKCSIARFTNRFYVIFEVNRLSNFDSFDFAFSHRIHRIEKICSKVSSNVSLKELHRWKSFKIHRFEKTLNIKIYIVERICTKTSN